MLTSDPRARTARLHRRKAVAADHLTRGVTIDLRSPADVDRLVAGPDVRMSVLALPGRSPFGVRAVMPDGTRLVRTAVTIDVRAREGTAEHVRLTLQPRSAEQVIAMLAQDAEDLGVPQPALASTLRSLSAAAGGRDIATVSLPTTRAPAGVIEVTAVLRPPRGDDAARSGLVWALDLRSLR